MISAGIDIGSRNTKLVVFDHCEQRIIFAEYLVTEIKAISSIESLFVKLEIQFPGLIEKISNINSTGYGRHLYQNANQKLSEISCHAAGVRYFFPTCRSIIDIGGQDSKFISLASNAKVLDFVMNDKCAAGTGRFLEMTALRLNCDLDSLTKIASKADQELQLSSTCVVFAESEIIGLMAANTKQANIVRAVHNSISRRICSQIGSLSVIEDLVFTGGVALNEDLLQCLSRDLKMPIFRPVNPEITGALGAAILANKYSGSL